MYCPSCGTAVTRGLNYCKRCGANLAPGANPHAPKLVALAWSIPLAMALITLVGLGMGLYIGLELTRRGADASPTGVLLLLASLLAVLFIDWMLVRQLSRVIDIYRPAGGAAGREQPEIGGVQVAQVEAMREPLSSAEQTTRAFEPAARGREAG